MPTEPSETLPAPARVTITVSADGRERYQVDVARIALAPGDTVVLTSPVPLRPQDVEFLHARLEAAFPGYPVLIMADGLTLGVLRHRTADPPGEDG